jgi:hypothetical protein
VDVRRAQLPRLPLEEQRHYGETFDRLHALEKLLAQIADFGDQLLTLTYDGIADGTLEPAS